MNEARAEEHWRLVVYPWILVVVAWGIILLAFATGYASLIDHDYLLRTGHLPWAMAFVLFLLVWQIMIAAMMLPATLSTISAVGMMGRGIGLRWLIQEKFILGYAFVWSLYACVAFVGDTLIHRLVSHWYWLYTHAWFIDATTLLIAGVFQFSPLKQSCLQHCREAATCSVPYNIGSAWRLGIRYGLFCVGACWAIMLVMFGIGMRSLLWMVLLAGVVLAEKEFSGGQWLRVTIGAGFLFLAILWLVFPIITKLSP